MSNLDLLTPRIRNLQDIAISSKLGKSSNMALYNPKFVSKPSNPGLCHSILGKTNYPISSKQKLESKAILPKPITGKPIVFNPIAKYS